MNRPTFTRTAVLALALAAATAAHAADPRLASRRYNPDEVVRIDGKAGVQAAIQFDEDEHIENVAIGDANAWQVTPNKRANMLFVKPLNASARTNMTVITDQRTYYFDLVAAASARPLYVLRFTYPDEPKQAAATSPGPALTAEEAAIAANGAGAVKPADPAALNFAWDRKGKAALFPSQVYDDGDSVYLAWPDRTPAPAILVRDASGAEGPVNYAVRGNTIVVEGTPRLIVLRWGRDVATLENRAPAAKPTTPALAATTTPQGN